MVRKKMLRVQLDCSPRLKRYEKWIRLSFLEKVSREMTRTLCPFGLRPVFFNLLAPKHILPLPEGWDSEWREKCRVHPRVCKFSSHPHGGDRQENDHNSLRALFSVVSLFFWKIFRRWSLTHLRAWIQRRVCHARPPWDFVQEKECVWRDWDPPSSLTRLPDHDLIMSVYPTDADDEKKLCKTPLDVPHSNWTLPNFLSCPSELIFKYRGKGCDTSSETWGDN